MADIVLMDNDVVLKTCCYDAADEVVDCMVGIDRSLHVLGVVQFVLSKAIKKREGIVHRDRAAERLIALLKRVALIEPNDDELLLAAEFEQFAQSHGVDLDGGESQLLAVLITRSAILLLTGDKRAIQAMELLLQGSPNKDKVARRVACLEQIAMALICRYGAEAIHSRVCGEAGVDKSLSICFSCTSGSCCAESIRDGLRSYITELRRQAPCVLVDSDDLSTFTT